MFRLLIIIAVVAFVFVNSPLRQPEPVLDHAAAGGGGALLAAARRDGVERALLAEGLRRSAEVGLDEARRALVPTPPAAPR